MLSLCLSSLSLYNLEKWLMLFSRRRVKLDFMFNWPVSLLAICSYSILQDKFELPSRLSVAAADCLLALTEGLTKKPDMLSNRPKSLNSRESNRPPVNLLASSVDEKKMKAAHESSEVLNAGLEYLLWDYLQDLIYLVQRLLAVRIISWLFSFNLLSTLIIFFF